MCLADIHGSNYEIVPAHSAGNAEAYFNDNPYIKVTAEFIGFHEVDISFSGSEIVFYAQSTPYASENIGYNYLYSHLRVQIDAFMNKLRNQGYLN